MLDEVARWDDLVTGLRPMTYGTKGEPVRCLVSVGPTIAAKASSEGWRLRLRPNNEAAGCDDLVAGLRPAMRGTKGKSASRLASVGAARLAKASSEGWRLRLRPNNRAD
jgi:hypothetical protein